MNRAEIIQAAQELYTQMCLGENGECTDYLEAWEFVRKVAHCDGHKMMRGEWHQEEIRAKERIE